MRKVDEIVIHCSATKEGQDVSIDTIRKWHKARGFYDVGYHEVIYLDGTRVKGRPVEKIGAHVQGANSNTIGICYIGGLGADGKPKDTRTPEQKRALREAVAEYRGSFPAITKVQGHRDHSPDKNGDGVIDSWEWLKACPCFDVKSEFV